MKLAINYKRGYTKSLDGLRGLAILMVFMYHCWLGTLKNIMQIGWIGVDLFFVLSGFLITGILYDTKKARNYYRNFIAKRALRIFPLYYFVIILFFAGALFFKDVKLFNYQLFYAPYFFTYTENIAFAFKGWPHNDILNHFWSLAIEEQFYLVWPFIILFFNSKQIIRISIVGILVSILIRNLYPTVSFAYIFTFARMDALLIGCITAIIIREKKEILESAAIPMLVVPFLALTPIIFITRNGFFNNIYFIHFGYTLFDIFFAGMLVLLFDTKKIGSLSRSFFEMRPLIFLGKYSYGIYIYHRILYHFISAPIEEMISRSAIISASAVHIASLLLFTAIVLLVSYASYHVFEKRFLEKKKYFT